MEYDTVLVATGLGGFLLTIAGVGLTFGFGPMVLVVGLLLLAFFFAA